MVRNVCSSARWNVAHLTTAPTLPLEGPLFCTKQRTPTCQLMGPMCSGRYECGHTVHRASSRGQKSVQKNWLSDFLGQAVFIKYIFLQTKSNSDIEQSSAFTGRRHSAPAFPTCTRGRDWSSSGTGGNGVRRAS